VQISDLGFSNLGSGNPIARKYTAVRVAFCLHRSTSGERAMNTEFLLFWIQVLFVVSVLFGLMLVHVDEENGQTN
jgi:hypothetical protein